MTADTPRADAPDLEALSEAADRAWEKYTKVCTLGPAYEEARVMREAEANEARELRRLYRAGRLIPEDTHKARIAEAVEAAVAEERERIMYEAAKLPFPEDGVPACPPGKGRDQLWHAAALMQVVQMLRKGAQT